VTPGKNNDIHHRGHREHREKNFKQQRNGEEEEKRRVRAEGTAKERPNPTP
jgi:hypothetical protein